jgi:hypothetical protein
MGHSASYTYNNPVSITFTHYSAQAHDIFFQLWNSTKAKNTQLNQPISTSGLVPNSLQKQFS